MLSCAGHCCHSWCLHWRRYRPDNGVRHSLRSGERSFLSQGAATVPYFKRKHIFALQEVDIGLAADVGTLQRLPKVIGNESLVREWCLTARNFDAKEAFESGVLLAVR